ncbi:hypothetical protein [Massilia sp. erpn]|uniref:hypothetical protein n=1 Tax=Massilia sp. erpn TaxID=2738142 RepID=UPI0021083BF9|nr:hypothetical protein [Massilia sp. erpn]UTY58790.1 hypothetical protein HPQ68_17280 [Massilia sp. erpn]
MKTPFTLALGAAALFGVATAAAVALPVRDDHPIVGTWRFVVPDGSCHEVYRIRADGTSLITSASEVAETEFVIADQPDEQGFYASSDKIVKDNGKQDCTGEITQVGQSVASFILFHPSKNMFLMCHKRDTKTCIGPFVRVRGSEV